MRTPNGDPASRDRVAVKGPYQGLLTVCSASKRKVVEAVWFW